MGDEIGFGVDERTAVPSQKEINSTISKISAPHIKKHILKNIFFWLPLTVLIIAGGAFAYVQFSGNAEGMTGGVVGIKDLPSKLTGFIINKDENLPITEKFDVKMSGAEINLLSEEEELQTNLRVKCTKEKTTSIEATKKELNSICLAEKNSISQDLNEEIDAIQKKYDNCRAGE